jgi:hypothetical protein
VSLRSPSDIGLFPGFICRFLRYYSGSSSDCNSSTELMVQCRTLSAGGGIRTHEPLRDEVLSLAPLTRLGDPRVRLTGDSMKLYCFTVAEQRCPLAAG